MCYLAITNKVSKSFFNLFWQEIWKKKNVYPIYYAPPDFDEKFFCFIQCFFLSVKNENKKIC